MSRTKVCSSLSELTLRNISCHENETSAPLACPCCVRTAHVGAMQRIIPSATCWVRVPTGRRMLRVAGRGPPRGTVTRPPPGAHAPRRHQTRGTGRALHSRPPAQPSDRHRGCDSALGPAIRKLNMLRSGDTLNVHSLQTMPR